MEPNVPPDFLGIVDATGLDQEFAVILVFRERFERVRNAGARKTLEDFQPVTLQAGILTDPKRRVDRERVNVRQKIASLVHHMNRRFAVRNSNMDVQSENQVCARKRLHVSHDFLIAFAFSDELIAPVRKRMGPDRCDLQSAAAGEIRQLAPQLNHMRPRVVDRIANLGAEFDDRLVHLGLDLLLEQDLATLEDFLNVRLQLARLRIDNRKLLFDAESVGVLLLGHWSPKSLSKTWRCHQVDRAVPCPPVGRTRPVASSMLSELA